MVLLTAWVFNSYLKTQKKIIQPRAEPAENPEEADGAEGEKASEEKPKKEKKKKVFFHLLNRYQMSI